MTATGNNNGPAAVSTRQQDRERERRRRWTTVPAARLIKCTVRPWRPWARRQWTATATTAARLWNYLLLLPPTTTTTTTTTTRLRFFSSFFLLQLLGKEDATREEIQLLNPWSRGARASLCIDTPGTRKSFHECHWKKGNDRENKAPAQSSSSRSDFLTNSIKRRRDPAGARPRFLCALARVRSDFASSHRIRASGPTPGSVYTRHRRLQVESRATYNGPATRNVF